MSDQHSGPPPRIVAATTNRAKQAKLQEMAGTLAHVIAPPPGMSLELNKQLADAENAASIETIARAKALAWSRALPREVVAATDGGLIVPALGDRWEPARTRRFAGELATDEARAKALLALAADLKGNKRRISWREALVLARNSRIIGQWVEESRSGLLATEVDPALVEAGGGFWIPAIWQCSNAGAGNRPLAILSADEQEACQDHWTKLGEHLRRALRLLAGE